LRSRPKPDATGPILKHRRDLASVHSHPLAHVFMPTPPTEAVLGTPLQVRRTDDETVVGIRDRHGRWVVLKRF